MNKTRPTAVLVGVPKCGTTSIFSFLSDHPEVCVSNVKETYFLMDKGHPLFNEKANCHRDGYSGYSQFFTHCTGMERVLMEATPDYFYQDTAFDVLTCIDPKPLIIFILREPANRAYSLFQFAKNNIGLLPTNFSFSAFVDNLLYNGGDMFKQRPILRNAIEHGKYSEHLRRWLDAFGMDGTLILLFEDLVADPIEFMKRLCNRLGIEQSVYDAYCFEKKNPTYAVRSTKLQRVKKKLHYSATGSVFRLFLKPLYECINIRGRIKKTPEDMATIAKLMKIYANYNEGLREMTGLDTSIWAAKVSTLNVVRDSNC